MKELAIIILSAQLIVLIAIVYNLVAVGKTINKSLETNNKLDEALNDNLKYTKWN